MYLLLSSVISLCAFGNWVNPRRFKNLSLIVFVFCIYFALVNYFFLIDLPDSIEYISAFAGDEYQIGAESWLFSMRFYAGTIKILSFGLLGPESMLVFARLLNLLLYLILFYSVSSRSVGQFIIISSYFFTSLLPYNCIFQIRAGFSYVVLLLLCRMFFGKQFRSTSSPFDLSLVMQNTFFLRWSRFLSISVPSMLGPLRLFKRLKIGLFKGAVFVIGSSFALILHSSSVIFLLSALTVYGWGFFAASLRLSLRPLVIRSIALASVLSVCIYLIINNLLEVYLPFLSGFDFANSAFSLVGQGETSSGFSLVILSARSLFFVYLACLYVTSSKTTLSYYFFFPMMIYGLFRPAFATFFSLARLLSPILVLQLFVLAAVRKYIVGKFHIVVTGIFMVVLMLTQAYSVSTILDQTTF